LEAPSAEFIALPALSVCC